VQRIDQMPVPTANAPSASHKARAVLNEAETLPARSRAMSDVRMATT